MSTKIEVMYHRVGYPKPEVNCEEMAELIRTNLIQYLHGYDDMQVMIEPRVYTVAATYEVDYSVGNCDYVAHRIKLWLEERGCKADITISQVIASVQSCHEEKEVGYEAD